MDLLESILKTADADEYLEKFRAEGIDPKSIKILSDKDLEMIGVDSQEKRNKILEQTKNLIITSEKKINIAVDAEYMDIALLHISNQLKLHNANLFCAANRADVINCNVHLHKATESLLCSITSMKQELKVLKQKILSVEPRKEASRKRNNLIIASISIAFLANVIVLWKVYKQ